MTTSNKEHIIKPTKVSGDNLIWNVGGGEIKTVFESGRITVQHEGSEWDCAAEVAKNSAMDMLNEKNYENLDEEERMWAKAFYSASISAL